MTINDFINSLNITPIEQKISVNIIKYSQRTKTGHAESNTTCENVKYTIIPILNSIWIQAGIHFSLRGCRYITPKQPRHNTKLYWSNETLYDGGSLHDPESHINIYIVPIMEGGTVGYSAIRGMRYNPGFYTVVSERYPEGVLKSMRHLATTIAHEIGHQLGLQHTLEPGRLMKGETYHYEQRDRLTNQEIRIARYNASRGLPPPPDYSRGFDYSRG